MKKVRYAWILALSAVGFVFSWLVYFQHKGSSALNNICGAIGSIGECDIVGASKYASLFFGIDNSIIGILGFGAMIYLSGYVYFVRPSRIYERLIVLGSIISGLLAVVFIFLQAAVIGAYCIYCLVVDAVSIGLFGIALQEILARKK